MLMELGTRRDEQHEKFNKVKIYKKESVELKNTITMQKYAKQNQQLTR